MQLILWRHAEAEDGIGKPDAERELTKKGRKQAETMAAWLRSRIGKDWRVLVSPARRTLETVKPLELAFKPEPLVGLQATPRALLEAAGWPDSEKNVVVVGHQPTLGEAAALLLGSEEDISIRKGAVWWFATRTRDGEVQTLLKVVMSPEEAGEGAE